MQHLHATHIASISELKKNPSKLIHKADGRPVAILNHNVATAYLIPAALFEQLLEHIDDRTLEKLVSVRLQDNQKPIRVDVDEL
ncbi:MAG: antitoxin [marine bacterium B5-7]|nr:MAG: antitoxin [marine bacterium B5-7]